MNDSAMRRARESDLAGADAKPPAAPPCAVVIFGAGGDLTKRLLVPALYNLARVGILPPKFRLIGVDHRERTIEDFRAGLRESVQQFAKTRGTEAGEFDAAAWARIENAVDYVQADFNDPAGYKRLSEHMSTVDRDHGTLGNILFYLAVASRFFAPITLSLAASGLMQEERDGTPWRRIIIEKPFGTDYASARALNEQILGVLRERQIYRIDHYLGKETVQNMMVLRFANGIFEPLWNRNHIDHIQITVAETVGVEQRGGYYDKSGALKDMVPNQLFQLLSLTAMEPPNDFSADSVRTEKVKVLDALRFPDPKKPGESAVRGQYIAGSVQGKPYKTYREESDVEKGSMTETYVAMKMTIDNWRWHGMPFYLRTGKAMTKRLSEISIQFKHPPQVMFRDTDIDRMIGNRLVIHVQPDEGVSLRFGAKVPGPALKLGRVWMNFHYADYFDAAPSTGYETLIYDCMMGDATRFQRADSVESGWRAVEPLLQAWELDPYRNFQNYPAGSAGPQIADEMLAKDGRAWNRMTWKPTEEKRS